MKQKPKIPQRPSMDGMILREVKTLWIYEHANRIGVRLFPEERRDDHDGTRKNEKVLSYRS